MEQTHQRTSKGPAGHYIVGCTRMVHLVTEFNILFDEIEVIRNLLSNVFTRNEVMNHINIYVHHELYGSKSMKLNKYVTNLLDFVRGNRNTYEMTHSPLYNFIIKQAVDENISERLVNAIENREIHYQECHKARIIGREKRLKDTIYRRNLPLFNHESSTKPILTKKTTTPSVKDVTAAPKCNDIDKERRMTYS